MAPAIPKDSIVLVTGINGYIGSHVADQFLEAGYRVRGTTRDLKKVESLKALWEKKFGEGKVEYVVVADMAKEGAFDEAVKGVSAVAHVASNLSFSGNPNEVIPEVISGLRNALLSAASSPTVKRFVYTSSSAALVSAKINTPIHLTTSTWNEEAIQAAWAPPPYDPSRGAAVYAASKAEGEKFLWKFVKEEKPGFVANSVNPNLNLGALLVNDIPASSGGFIKGLYNAADMSFLQKACPPQWAVDVQDVARLHVAAVIDPEIENERILAFATNYTWNDVLNALRKIEPDHKFSENFGDDNDRDISTVENERGAELLKKHFGRDGWTGLEESLKNAIASLK